MLEDVIAAAKDANCSPVIIATELFDSEDIQITIPDKDLSGTLNEVLRQSVGSILILMADLPLATGAAIKRVIATKSDMASCQVEAGGQTRSSLPSGKIPCRLLRYEFLKAPEDRAELASPAK